MVSRWRGKLVLRNTAKRFTAFSNDEEALVVSVASCEICACCSLRFDFMLLVFWWFAKVRGLLQSVGSSGFAEAVLSVLTGAANQSVNRMLRIKPRSPGYFKR